jgi:PAS domain-containing protein
MAVATAVFFDDVASAIVAGAAALTGAEGGALWLHEPESFVGNDPVEPHWTCVLDHTLHPVLREEFTERGAPLPMTAAVEEVIRTGEAQCGTFSDDTTASGTSPVYELALPFTMNGQVMAVLELHWANNEVSASFCKDQELLKVFCEHASVELANARLFERLESAKREWETSFDGMIDGVCIESSNGTILRANRVLAEMFNMDVKELLGRTLMQICQETPLYEQLRSVEPIVGDVTGRNVCNGEFRFGAPERIIQKRCSRCGFRLMRADVRDL